LLERFYNTLILIILVLQLWVIFSIDNNCDSCFYRALSTISTGFLQQAIAYPKGLIENIHEHFNCDASGNCDEFARGGTINSPILI
jgi:hypothetical protein